MKLAKHLLGAVFFLALTACAFQQPRSDADYGAVPGDYQQLIVAYYQDILKDPESAKYKFELPQRAYGNTGLAYGGGVTWIGMAVRIQINAKNSFGGYTGFKPYTVFFTNGRVTGQAEGWSPLLVTFVD